MAYELDPREVYREDPTNWANGYLEVKVASDYPCTEYLVDGWAPIDEKPRPGIGPSDIRYRPMHLDYLPEDLSNRIVAIRQYMKNRFIHFTYEEFQGSRVYLSFDLIEEEKKCISLALLKDLANELSDWNEGDEYDISIVTEFVSGSWSEGEIKGFQEWYGFIPEFQVKLWDKTTELVCNISPIHKELYSIIEALNEQMHEDWSNICNTEYIEE